MDVLLHIGAHRSASTTFQAYMRSNAVVLADGGIGYWGPFRLRRKMFHGVIPNPKHGVGAAAFERARGRIGMHLEKSRERGVSKLVVSDENMIGTMRYNFASASLYPAAGERMSRFSAAFAGKINGITLQVRALDTYWPSAVAFCIPRGLRVPDAAKMARLAEQQRNWRDVITDIAAAFPGVKISVSSFERMASHPDQVVSALTGHRGPPSGGIWRNARPPLQELLRLPLSASEREMLTASQLGTHWCPFTESQRAELRERYADDLFWLQSGADGLASYLEEPKLAKTGITPQRSFMTRGQNNDGLQRLARPG